MKVQRVCLDAGDAVELGELLEFLDGWMNSDAGRLATSFGRFVGHAGFDIDELRAELSRFAVLLGWSNAELLVGEDER